MGQVTRVLITGAAGFIGRETVAAARARDMTVVAVVRRHPPPEWQSDPGIATATCDLSDMAAEDALAEILEDCDAVIHLAAALSSDADRVTRDTDRSTQALAGAIRKAGVARAVLASSIAVYDTTRIPVGGVLDETCPLQDPASASDGYAASKLRQEATMRAAGCASLMILRPGVVHDGRDLWNAHLGLRAGPALLRIGGQGEVPLCHVKRCAAALVESLELDRSESINLLDSELPNRDEVIAYLRRAGWPKLVVWLPWQLLRGVARTARPFQSRLPGLLKEDVLWRRMMPLHYDDSKLRRILPGLPAPNWRRG